MVMRGLLTWDIEKEAGEDLEEDFEDDDAANGKVCHHSVTRSCFNIFSGDGDIEGEENLSTQAPLENSDGKLITTRWQGVISDTFHRC